MGTYVFCGPSISLSRARDLAPHAEILAPIKRGDLLRRRLSHSDTVVIIDGYFFYTASIQHMEILHAIDRGVTVIGAASMGALRAAELHSFGMFGVGRIFEQFRDGILIADDEVTLLHDPESYACYTESLVNLRHNLTTAREAGVISSAATDLAMTRLARTWFGHRTRVGTVRLLRENGFASEAERLNAHWSSEFFNLKEADAMEALRAISSCGVSKPTGIQETVFSHLIQEDYTLADEEHELPEALIVHYCQVSEPDLPAIYRRASLLRLLDLAMPPEALSRTVEDRFHDAARRADDAERQGELLEQVCCRALVSAGILDPSAGVASVEALALPVLIAPGQPVRDFLTVELKRLGIFQRATAELASFIREKLAKKVSREVIRHGRSHRDYVVRLYSSLWGVMPEQLEPAARRRGFRDLEDLLQLGGRVVITSKIANDRVVSARDAVPEESRPR